MKKLDNFSNCLSVLKNADFKLAENNEIYRTGVIGQFNLTFELAWKALQEVLKLHGAAGAETGSPREILQLGYRLGFVNDSAVWLLMLKKEIHLFIYITKMRLMKCSCLFVTVLFLRLLTLKQF
ncbi:MAG: HI0074 family nucleotidyltransferase substrate-binding subunit [Ruminococcus sp.]